MLFRSQRTNTNDFFAAFDVGKSVIDRICIFVSGSCLCWLFRRLLLLLLPQLSAKIAGLHLATHRRQTTAIDKQVRGAELLGKKAAEAREEARRLNDDAVRQRLRANGWYRED